ncbi:MAG: helix-turn-helix domain-containing protein [Synechococcus sp.]
MSRIGELRKEANLTQRELAEAVGVTEVSIRNWEQGKAGLDWIVKVHRLTEALGCAVSDLFSDLEAEDFEKKHQRRRAQVRMRTGSRQAESKD